MVHKKHSIKINDKNSVLQKKRHSLIFVRFKYLHTTRTSDIDEGRQNVGDF